MCICKHVILRMHYLHGLLALKWAEHQALQNYNIFFFFSSAARFDRNHKPISFKCSKYFIMAGVKNVKYVAVFNLCIVFCLVYKPRWLETKLKTGHVAWFSVGSPALNSRQSARRAWLVIDVFESGGFFPPWGVSTPLTEAPLKCIMSSPPLAEWKSGSQRGRKMRAQRTWLNGQGEWVSAALPTAGSD